MQATTAVAIVAAIGTAYYKHRDLENQKKESKASAQAKARQTDLQRLATEAALQEEQRRNKNLLAQQQATYKAKLGASGLSSKSGSGQVVLDNMQKEHDMEDKYLVEKKDNSLAQLQTQLDLENRKNLLRQRTLSNNQRVSALNSTSNIVDMISDALSEKQKD